MPEFEKLEPRQLFAADLASGLVAHWDFEDAINANVYADVSTEGASHDAERIADALLVIENSTNQFARLNGNTDRLVADASANTNSVIQTNYTLAIRFKAADISPSNKPQIIFEQGQATRGLNIYLFDSRLYVGAWNTDITQSGWAGTWLSTDQIQSGQWHHVALTLDGGPTVQTGALTGYLDGKIFGTGEGSQLWPHPSPIVMGNITGSTLLHNGDTPSGPTTGFIGDLDEGRIYQRTLAPEEIQTLGGRDAASRLAASADYARSLNKQNRLEPDNLQPAPFSTRSVISPTPHVNQLVYTLIPRRLNDPQPAVFIGDYRSPPSDARVENNTDIETFDHLAEGECHASEHAIHAESEYRIGAGDMAPHQSPETTETKPQNTDAWWLDWLNAESWLSDQDKDRIDADDLTQENPETVTATVDERFIR